MAGRFPFNQQGHSGQNPLHDAQIRAALGLSQAEEQLYMQRQQELQRDFQIRQMLLQDQIDQQNRLEHMLHEQRLKQIREQLADYPDLQQHYSGMLLRDRQEQLGRLEEQALRERAQMQREELQRRAIAESQVQQQANAQQANVQQANAQQANVQQANVQQAQAQVQQVQSQAQSQVQAQAQTQNQTQTPSKAANVLQAQTLLRDIAADSLAGNAVKRSDLEKRVFAKAEDEVPAAKKRARSESVGDYERKLKKKRDKGAEKKDDDSVASEEVDQCDPMDNSMRLSAQTLFDFASSTPSYPIQFFAPPAKPKVGTLGDLLAVANAEKKSDDAVSALVGIKSVYCDVEWSESEREDELEEERRIAIKKGDTIQLPGFTSILPQLPEEPEIVVVVSSKRKKKKHRGLLDDDSVEAKQNGKTKSDKKKESRHIVSNAKAAELNVVEYPYPIDTWWPSVTSVRRERKVSGEPQDEDKFEEDPDLVDADSRFRAPVEKIRENFSTEVAPGVLEKIPHCRIHRMLMKKRKNPSAPELVYCFQVTELYPNDVMVCCSHCGTWRHTSCGGHYKPYSVRECIDTPFTAVCDRCHEEERILHDNPVARKRIDRQRSEQVRRGLATSAAMRQASFSKHGGTYKWPLGSVSATHIGGHTRSVHSRHDKAEKQWMDMATRLGRGYGYRPKERVKVRTKELERLLVSVEDAEGHTDRHNMMLFLLNDTLKEHPIGFETRRRNIFDPEEDDMPVDALDMTTAPPVTESPAAETDKDVVVKADENVADPEGGEEEDEIKKSEPTICARLACTRKPRFDSLFCSDSCGVSALESDLLRTFQYASDIHPSLLRN